jgi:hypothetical protein
MRRRTLHRVLFCVIAGLTLAVSGARPAAGQDLQQTLERAAAAWHRGDAAGLASLAARAGISIDVDGRSVGPVGQRQAAAIIRRLFDDIESVGVRTRMVRGVGGDPPRAFGEFAWTTKIRGTTIPDDATVFVALIREGDRWRVTEIRLLR